MTGNLSRTVLRGRALVRVPAYPTKVIFNIIHNIKTEKRLPLLTRTMQSFFKIWINRVAVTKSILFPSQMPISCINLLNVS
jgi:hypothetical protein